MSEGSAGIHSALRVHRLALRRMLSVSSRAAGREHGRVTSIDELRSYILTTEQLISHGHSTQSLGREVASGALVRLHPGFYVKAAARDLDRTGRHLLTMLAADSAMADSVFTHWSAAMVHGLPDWGLPLRTVSVSRYGHAQRSRSTRLTRHDLCPLASDEIVAVDGVSVTSADRTIIDIARTCGREPSVAVADAGLNAGIVTEVSLRDALDRASGRSGIRRARSAIGLTDGSSESVAETRSRLCFAEYGLPEPETQVDIFDRDGRFIGRVDFLWREFGVIGECDGLGKYFDGADTMETRRRLGLEKDRDALLTALGYRVLHWRWADFERPWSLAQRVRRVLHAAAA